MLRRLALPALLILLLAMASAASADEPVPKGFEGTFLLKGTHGYRILGLIGSTGTEGTLALLVGKRGAAATYEARGEVTREHVHFDLGELGEIEVTVQSTGRSEVVKSACGKPRTLEGEEYVGTIAFHGEEGFTTAEATKTPLRLDPLLNLVCGSPAGEVESGGHLSGVALNIKAKDGPRLHLIQNHPGARVFYEAKMSEEEGDVKVQRAVSGHLGGGALSYAASLESAGFSGETPFAGHATYSGKAPAREIRPGHGTWNGNLTVDFPGHAGVRLSGPTFSASIIHARRGNPHR